MKIEDTTTRTIKIWDVEYYFDIILVNLSNVYPGAGRLTLTADSDSWSYFWGGMGEDRTLEQFLLDTNVDYLVDKLGAGICPRLDAPEDEACIDAIQTAIMKSRRRGHISKHAARSAWWNVEGCENVYQRFEYEGDFEACELVDEVDWPRAGPNPAYERLTFAVTKMREALKQLEDKKNAVPEPAETV